MSFLCLAQGEDFFDSEIVEINIEFQDIGWQDTLIARKQRDSKEALLTSVHINGVRYEEIEVRFKGNSSFHGALKQGWQKLPLRMKVASGKGFEGRYKILRLANNYRDPSAIRELLAYQIAGTYVPVPKVVPASVTINGEYVGLYTLTEGMGKAMITEYYCDNSGTLIECEPTFGASPPAGCPKGDYANLQYLGEEPSCYKRLYELEDEKKSSSLINLTRSLAENKRLDTVINVHQALWMHAVNNVLVNLDSYLGMFCHNYFVYQDRHGIYHPLIWDLNLAFGGFAPIAAGESPDPVKLSPIAHNRFHLGKRPLIQKLTNDKIDARLYFWMMKTIVEDWISSGKYLEIAKELQDRIRPFVEREEGALYTLDDFDKSMSESTKRNDHRSIIGIAQLMEPRAEYLLNHVLLNKVPPTVSDCSSELSDGNMHVTLMTSKDVNRVQVRYKDSQCGKPQIKLMQKIEPGNWQCDIPPGSLYYCVISSDSCTSLYPSHAPMEWLGNNL